jgi:hypothetical protein
MGALLVRVPRASGSFRRSTPKITRKSSALSLPHGVSPIAETGRGANRPGDPDAGGGRDAARTGQFSGVGN